MMDYSIAFTAGGVVSEAVDEEIEDSVNGCGMGPGSKGR